MSDSRANIKLSSHDEETSDYIDVAYKRIEFSDLPVEKKTILYGEVELAKKFPFGLFMLKHHGVNGQWSHNLLPWLFLSKLCELPGGVTLDPAKGEFTNSLQEFLYTQAPLVVATQQRFEIFIQQIKLYLQSVNEKVCVANFPCGWMSDVCFTLKLNQELTNKINITGFDLDESNGNGVVTLLRQLGIDIPFTFVKADATKALGSEETFAVQADHAEKYDFIIAHGLSLYLDDADCYAYFLLLAAMLKPAGKLLTSTMTPPAEWKNVDTTLSDRQYHFFYTICDSKFSVFRGVYETNKLLSQVGLEIMDVHEDSCNMFPTILAKKN